MKAIIISSVSIVILGVLMLVFGLYLNSGCEKSTCYLKTLEDNGTWCAVQYGGLTCKMYKSACFDREIDCYFLPQLSCPSLSCTNQLFQYLLITTGFLEFVCVTAVVIFCALQFTRRREENIEAPR